MTMIKSISQTTNAWLAAAMLLAAIAGSTWSQENPFGAPAPKAGEPPVKAKRIHLAERPARSGQRRGEG
jgi:hypothetical protein